jgi:hypothetical protein
MPHEELDSFNIWQLDSVCYIWEYKDRYFVQAQFYVPDRSESILPVGNGEICANPTSNTLGQAIDSALKISEDFKQTIGDAWRTTGDTIYKQNGVFLMKFTGCSSDQSLYEKTAAVIVERFREKLRIIRNHGWGRFDEQKIYVNLSTSQIGSEVIRRCKELPHYRAPKSGEILSGDWRETFRME